MRRISILYLLVLPLLVIPLNASRTGDWQAVKDLFPGIHISVKAKGISEKTYCYFERATDNQIFCTRSFGSSAFGSHEFVYDREKVVEIRHEYTETFDNHALGAIIGGGAGVAFGAAAGNGGITREGGALLFGFIGALTGSHFALGFPVRHSKLVYHQ
jgi:hypothetical protein